MQQRDFSTEMYNMTRMGKKAKLCLWRMSSRKRSSPTWSWTLTLSHGAWHLYLHLWFERLMDLSDTNLLYAWKLDLRTEVHPEGFLRTTLIRTGLWYDGKRNGSSIPKMIMKDMQNIPSWLELCLDGHAKLMFQLLLVRVARTVGNPFEDLSSFATMMASSAAPSGCLHLLGAATYRCLLRLEMRHIQCITPNKVSQHL